ncbi:mannosyl-oligosaccharide alpha-1,2-mannosidase IA [Drosophila ficusphila]|uniref:mannosyl-oligosaccharide alpha-1,2-mannosidase IA n=1 Tax=Drosophila ficusphila TaxID=30025 RepID=UPI0007E5DE55|nr:mannosyl-oligosaccharide alpha-1,2-mannosidase IA [Drosophila ficusphila]
MYFLHFAIRRAHYNWYTANTTSRIRIIATGVFTIGVVVFTFVQCYGLVRQFLKEVRATESVTNGFPNQENPAVMRRKIKEMMLHSWRSYARVVWGTNEFRPISRRVHIGSDFGSYKVGATIIESLDTLYLMGLKKELNRSRDWLEKSFSLDRVDEPLSVFELTSRLLCPMLTLYSLTGDLLYKEKAVHIANKILPAFETATGIPRRLVVPKEGSTLTKYLESMSRISEFGALHLEFFYLSEITGLSIYKDRAEGIRKKLATMNKPNGLYPNSFCTNYGLWENYNCSMNRFYDCLLKSWVQSGKTDLKTLDLFKDALPAVVQNLVVIKPEGQAYVTEMRKGTLSHRMKQTDCFAGALFVLGAAETLMEHWEKYAEIGVAIVDTCHDKFWSSPTQLGPDLFAFTEQAQKDIVALQRDFYMLRPEIVESYLVLWRLTHNTKYRIWGREIFLAIEKYCRTPYGYSGIMDVYNISAGQDDVQRTFFLGATLKYLFLLFSDDNVIPLEDWVFNSAGHFLPIKGANSMYRQYNTKN